MKDSVDSVKKHPIARSWTSITSEEEREFSFDK